MCLLSLSQTLCANACSLEGGDVFSQLRNGMGPIVFFDVRAHRIGTLRRGGQAGGAGATGDSPHLSVSQTVNRRDRHKTVWLAGPGLQARPGESALFLAADPGFLAGEQALDVFPMLADQRHGQDADDQRRAIAALHQDLPDRREGRRDDGGE